MDQQDSRALTVLVVNDDGPHSPLLIPFLDALRAESWCAKLRVVIPAKEQSWIGKAISRFSVLTATDHQFGTHPGILIDGTPADCASLGVNNLETTRPDFVLSGINMGTNAGSAFLLSSGTVGGAIEGSLYHVPAIAFSAHLPGEIFTPWRNQDFVKLGEMQEHWIRFSRAAARVARALVTGWDATRYDLISVNLPWTVSDSTPMVETSLAPTHFHGLFGEVGPRQYRHKFQGLKTIKTDDPFSEIDPKDVGREYLPTDIATLESELIAVTPIRYSLSARLSPEQLQRVGAP